jgi:N-acetylmuramoyl-L-alanine amidase
VPTPPSARPQPSRTGLPAAIRSPGSPATSEQATAEPPRPQVPKSVAPAKPKAEAALLPENPKTAAAEPPLAPPESGKAAKRTSSGASSLVRALGLKLARVVIDPGHGGHDQGTQGPHGFLEKDLVLDVSLRLGALIAERLGAEVIYTRSDDTFIPLEGRTALANQREASLFLSIHANSSPLPHVAGVETFYLSISGTKDAMDVASRENASSQKSIFELNDVLQKIARQDKSEESKEFAHRIQAELYAFSARNVPGSKNRGVKSAPFMVLIGANMPSILAEIGFLSNPKEEALLKKPDYRQKLADALCRGVSRYADSLSHFQVALTPANADGRP